MRDVRETGSPGFTPSEQVGRHRLGELLRAVMTVGSDLDLDATLRRIVEAAVSLVDARYGALGVIDEAGTGLSQFITVGVDEVTHEAIGALPKGHGLLGTLIDHAQPLRIADITEHPDSVGFPPAHPPMRSFLGVPIQAGGVVFGSLYLTDKITDEAFTDIDEELAIALAAQAGVAVDHARLFELAERQRAALAAVHEVATAFADTEPQQLLALVARHARELVSADLATIAVPEPSGEVLMIEVADGPLAIAFSRERFPREGSVSGDVMDSAETVVLHDASCDLRSAQPQVRDGHIGPTITVALRADGRLFGTLGWAAPGARPPSATRKSKWSRLSPPMPAWSSDANRTVANGPGSVSSRSRNASPATCTTR
jgi:GAF domain-containing protein